MTGPDGRFTLDEALAEAVRALDETLKYQTNAAGRHLVARVTVTADAYAKLARETAASLRAVRQCQDARRQAFRDDPWAWVRDGSLGVQPHEVHDVRALERAVQEAVAARLDLERVVPGPDGLECANREDVAEQLDGKVFEARARYTQAMYLLRGHTAPVDDPGTL